MTKKKNHPKPSIRQRKFVAEKMKGKSSSQAARDAGYSEGTARHAQMDVAEKPAVVEIFKQAMRKAGITDPLLAKRLREGIDAKETKFFQKDGEVVSTRSVVSHSERRAHLEIALKIAGHLTDTHTIVGKLTLAELLEESGRVKEE